MTSYCETEFLFSSVTLKGFYSINLMLGERGGLSSGQEELIHDVKGNTHWPP